MTTLNQVAMDMGMYEVPIQLLEHFVENYQNKSFTLEVLKNDKVLHTPLKKEKPKTVKKEKKGKKSVKSPTKSLEERQVCGIIEDKCQCRIWKGGLDNIQCSGKKIDGTDFCGRHKDLSNEWWLGLITEPRPEEPVGPNTSKNPNRHYWNDQEKPTKTSKTKKSQKVEKPVKEKVEKKKKKKKRKIKKEAEVVADEPIEKIVSDVVEEMVVKTESDEVEEPDIELDSPKKDIGKDITDTSMEDIFGKSGEILPGVADYLVCATDSDDDEVGVDFEYDGVIYIRLPKDDLIMDRRTAHQMGYLQKDGSIKFFPGKNKVHEKNKED